MFYSILYGCRVGGVCRKIIDIFRRGQRFKERILFFVVCSVVVESEISQLRVNEGQVGRQVGYSFGLSCFFLCQVFFVESWGVRQGVQRRQQLVVSCFRNRRFSVYVGKINILRIGRFDRVKGRWVVVVYKVWFVRYGIVLVSFIFLVMLLGQELFLEVNIVFFYEGF